MFQSLICSGDSFTSGYGLEEPTKAWPYILTNKLNISVINLAREGMGNEYIFNSIVENNLENSLVIIGLTAYSRVEFIDAATNKIFTTIPNRRGATEFDNLFWINHYDDDYYFSKFCKQWMMFDAYMKQRNAQYYMFDALPVEKTMPMIPHNYLWHGDENMCSITYPHKLTDGHPNETAHEIMAEKLLKIILDKFL
jgi:hypothetical protein